MCKKSGKFEVVNSNLISTVVSPINNSIKGEIRSATIYDQLISWGQQRDIDHKSLNELKRKKNGITHLLIDVDSDLFDLATIVVYGDCKFFFKHTRVSGYCCSRFIGQLRIILYVMKTNFSI